MSDDLQDAIREWTERYHPFSSAEPFHVSLDRLLRRVAHEGYKWGRTDTNAAAAGLVAHYDDMCAEIIGTALKDENDER
jgi:hypothetical protein